MFLLFSKKYLHISKINEQNLRKYNLSRFLIRGFYRYRIFYSQRSGTREFNFKREKVISVAHIYNTSFLSSSQFI